MPRARHPAPLRPNRDRYSYGSLSNGAKDTLVDRFLRWTFSPPNHIGTARQLRAGQWLPMQPDYFQGEHPLGEGGMGIVHLWCCVDENNRIRDRGYRETGTPWSHNLGAQRRLAQWRDRRRA